MIVQSYTQFGGVHPETATITNVLASQGVTAPHTGLPYSEAMILGIAGGLGCGYILWEFKKYDSAILVMGFQNRWNYPMEFMQNLSDRLGVQAEFLDTGGKKKAAQDLEDALAAGRPAITWIDQQSLPYFYMQPMYNGCFGHYVTAYGLEEDLVLVDDRAKKPLRVETAVFNQARARIGSYKNRLLLLSAPTTPINLETAIRAGLDDCVEYLGRDSQTFAIPVYRKWARLMTDTSNKKGWPVVFKERKGLYSTLRSLHEGIKLFGTAGGGLRGFYADFLGEAGAVLGNSDLGEAAAHYRQLAQRWSTFADAVLPDSIAPLAETRRLLAQKYAIFDEQGGDGLEALGSVSQELADMEEELNSHLPIGDEEMNDLFEEMQEQLLGIYAVENEALEALKASIA